MLTYQRARFTTQLPEEHLYTAAHSWLCRLPGTENRWRVGFTKFALRMLGQIVEVNIDCPVANKIEPGDIVGSIEGFKALSDIYSAGSGAFWRGNPDLGGSVEAFGKSPYQEGWLYEFDGVPDQRAMDVHGYCQLLDGTIDRLLEKEQTAPQT